MNVTNSFFKLHIEPKKNIDSKSQERSANTISRRLFLKTTSLASILSISSCPHTTSDIRINSQKQESVAADCHLHMNSPATLNIPNRIKT